ncbi:MAG: MauE/DoxX family redox-associated membrane protein [Phycisphaerales bacterium]|jgi:uncharacterized membrane protein YphA (DoxX/SURF4 family)|nr:MauE/DoxX family redox-associated membrane protein [Phycisphaerales bacterium]
MSTSAPTAARRVPGPIESTAMLALRVLLAALFGFAAWVKLRDPQYFLTSVKGFRLIPEIMQVQVTYLVPWIEAACAVLLLLGLWTRAAAVVLSLAIVGFIAGLFEVVQAGRSVECGCFGKFSFICDKGPLGWCNIAQNAGLLICAVVLVIRGGGRAALDWALDRPGHASGENGDLPLAKAVDPRSRHA